MNDAACKARSLWDEIEELAIEARKAVAEVDVSADRLHTCILNRAVKGDEPQAHQEPTGFAEKIRLHFKEITEIAIRSNDKLRELQ